MGGSGLFLDDERQRTGRRLPPRRQHEDALRCSSDLQRRAAVVPSAEGGASLPDPSWRCDSYCVVTPVGLYTLELPQHTPRANERASLRKGDETRRRSDHSSKPPSCERTKYCWNRLVQAEQWTCRVGLKRPAHTGDEIAPLATFLFSRLSRDSPQQSSNLPPVCRRTRLLTSRLLGIFNGSKGRSNGRRGAECTRLISGGAPQLYRVLCNARAAH